MFGSSRAYFFFKVTAAVSIFIWLLFQLRISSGYGHVLRQLKGERGRFVTDFLENEIDGPFNGEPIAALCSNKTWTKGLIFNCNTPAGGIGVVRNAHLNCIRFAIEAGGIVLNALYWRPMTILRLTANCAAELVIPEIVRRDDNDIARVNPHSSDRGVKLDYLYDKDHLIQSLSAFCPQMKLYQSLDDLWDKPMPNPISSQDLQIDRENDTVITHPETWAKQFKEFFDSKSAPKTRTWPVRVNIHQSLYTWPTAYGPPDFVQNFGRLLRFRQDVRQLAASALFTLQKNLTALNLPEKGPIRRKGFVGLHLRTEKDIWTAGWPSYDDQAEYYLDYVVRSRYPVAYLASGAMPDNITAFAEQARASNIMVVTKQDLLAPDELEYLESLTWDQQALVDWELMLRADRMAGICESAFSWNIALRRAASIGSVGGRSHGPQAGHIRWQDRLSAIMGRQENKNMNMQLAIWP